MTIAPTPSINVILPTGTAVGPWPTGFTYSDPTDVRVMIETDGVAAPPLSPGAGYTLTATDPRQSGGNVTLNPMVVPAGGWTPAHRLILRRRTARRQGTALPDAEGHKPRATERALDHAMRISQEDRDDLDRSLMTPPGESGLTLPPAGARADKLMTFDAEGRPVAERELGEFDADVSQTAENREATEQARDQSQAARDAAERARIEAAEALRETQATAEFAIAQAQVVGTREQTKLVRIPANLTALRTSGYWERGDGGDALYRRVTDEPEHAGKFQSADGAWWEISERVFYPQMFGVQFVPSGVHNIAVARARECSAQMNACIRAAKALGAGVFVPEGRYAHADTIEWCEGVNFLGVGGLSNWRPGPTGGNSTPLELYKDTGGALFVAIDSFPKKFTADKITRSFQCGYYRPLLPEDRIFNNEYDENFELLDLTNQDAVGAQRATLKPFSVAHHFQGNTMNRFRISGISAIVNCPDPASEPGGFGTGGYGIEDALVPWDDVDIGVFCQSPWRGDISFNVLGYYNLRGWLVTPAREGAANAGYAEHTVYRDMLVQGGFAIRSKDPWPVLSKTSNTVTVRWTSSHCFGPSGFLWIGTSSYSYTSFAYSSLTYDDSGPFPTLTFGGIADTSPIVVTGDSKHLIFQQVGAGFALTSHENCEFYDFSPACKVDTCSPIYGARQMKYRACYEISGDPIRALRFNNVIAHPMHGPAVHIGKAWDLEMVRCYHEARGRRDVLGVSGGIRGSVRIFGPKTDMLAETGIYGTGSIDIVGRTFWPGINGLPVGTRPSSIYRFRNMDGLWNTRDGRTGPAMELSAYLEMPGIQDIINDNRSLTLQGDGGGHGMRYFSSQGQLRLGSTSNEPLQLHRASTSDALVLRRNGETVGALAMSVGRMRLTMNAEGASWSSGSGSPNGQISSPVGALWTRTDGGASSTLYIKESGTGNTGWVAK